jgi:hypothetical protein
MLAKARTGNKHYGICAFHNYEIKILLSEKGGKITRLERVDDLNIPATLTPPLTQVSTSRRLDDSNSLWLHTSRDPGEYRGEG